GGAAPAASAGRRDDVDREPWDPAAPARAADAHGRGRGPAAARPRHQPARRNPVSALEPRSDDAADSVEITSTRLVTSSHLSSAPGRPLPPVPSSYSLPKSDRAIRTLGVPQEPAHVPARIGQVLGVPALARLHHGDALSPSP